MARLASQSISFWLICTYLVSAANAETLKRGEVRVEITHGGLLRTAKSGGQEIRTSGDTSGDETLALGTTLAQWKQDVIQRSADMNCTGLANKSVLQADAQRCLWLGENVTDLNSAKYLTSIPVYYISLGGERPHKWFQRYELLSPNIHIIDGVNGSHNEDVEKVVAQSYESFGKQNVTHGVLGCALSHMRAIKAAYDSGAEVALILEDDAVPDLAPWWPQSLENYIDLLPRTWQLSQLAWTSQPYYAREKYYPPPSILPKVKAGEPTPPPTPLPRVNGTLFTHGAHWGTVAYLIHRRGMEQIMGKLWDDKVQKFNVSEMMHNCPHFTADDCLLSCSKFDELAGWIPGQAWMRRKNCTRTDNATKQCLNWVTGPLELMDVKKRMLEETYKAVPPMFTSYVDHLSLQSEDKRWVTASYCDDIHGTWKFSKELCAQTAAAALATESEVDKPKPKPMAMLKPIPSFATIAPPHFSIPEKLLQMIEGQKKK